MQVDVNTGSTVAGPTLLDSALAFDFAYNGNIMLCGGIFNKITVVNYPSLSLFGEWSAIYGASHIVNVDDDAAIYIAETYAASTDCSVRPQLDSS